MKPDNPRAHFTLDFWGSSTKVDNSTVKAIREKIANNYGAVKFDVQFKSHKPIIRLENVLKRLWYDSSIDVLNGSEAAGKEHNEYQDSIINELTVENFKNLPECFGEEFDIEIKLTGEIDIAPFISIFTRRQSAKLSNESMITKATEMCTHWQEKIKDSAWSPFKKVTINGIAKEIVDDNDVELKKLRKEMGFSVFMAVAKLSCCKAVACEGKQRGKT
ncbi:hypothetical protein POM88_047604 [Heracleum sosnowskyi]|uniref:Factor of DNA methylation 1-5/IDN2 domain-containing protein n=1 Tax=Heracleum sosnowskyi TaxID=360622 RepID=A0AAD8LZS3_9APIA|nr:hypothetical protein POM88_047604 [Heracleum sosnowskyi]